MAETAILAPPESFEDIVRQEFEFQMVRAVAELPTEEFNRERAAYFIGSVAIEQSVASTEQSPARYTLSEATHRAYHGEAAARMLVETNVRTDVVERTFKDGHVMRPIELDADAFGNVTQHEQNIDDIQANSLLFASESWQMRERTKAEVRNTFRFQTALIAGDLNEYAWVVRSPAADNMTREEMDDAGFFGNAMSIQVTQLTESGLTLESAFVAGEINENAKRNDIETLNAMDTALGLESHYQTALEVLDSPLLIHKSLIPNGVVDVVKMFDQVNGTFYGREVTAEWPAQDYLAHREQCYKKQDALNDVVEQVTQELIAEAPNIVTPTDATEKLNYLAGQKMVVRAVENPDIDARVFGAPAAFRIEHARHLIENGDIQQAAVVTRQAQKVETSSSCPSGTKKATTELDIDGTDNSSTTEKTKDCDFVSKKCPVCGEKNAKTQVRNGVYHHVPKGCKR
jgi:hypothetical protein